MTTSIRAAMLDLELSTRVTTAALSDASAVIAANTSQRDSLTSPASTTTPGTTESPSGDQSFWTEASWWAFACGICVGLLAALIAFVAVVAVTS